MQIGTQIGSYHIKELIGQGGMAEVFRAWHVSLHRDEALKALSPRMAHDPAVVERFLTEARISARLRHPNIATIHTVSTPSEQPYFTMELIEGQDLADYLRSRGALTPAEAFPLLQQIASALDYAHSQGVIHRDVKPGNVLLQQQPDGEWVAKVVDFGIARAQETGAGTRLTQTGMIVGTPEYMSPEQAGSGAQVGAGTDQYSLGVMAYEMMCGRPPFGADGAESAISVIMQHVGTLPRPPLELIPSLRPELSNAILRALSKNPADRFPSCVEFVNALSVRQEDRSDRQKWSDDLRDDRAGKRSKNRPLVPIIAGVLLLAGIGMVVATALRSKQDSIAPIQPAGASTSRGAVSYGGSSGQDERLKYEGRKEEAVEVPTLQGQTESQARDTLTAGDLTAGTHREHSAFVEAGRVTRQSPAARSRTARNTTVDIWISDGPEKSTPPPPAPSGRLTEANLAGKSAWDLNVMRNDYYARHGYQFKSAELTSHFKQFSWYRPHLSDPDLVERNFSEMERYNAAFILAYQQSHGLVYKNK